MILPDVNVLVYAFRKDVHNHAWHRPSGSMPSYHRRRAVRHFAADARRLVRVTTNASDFRKRQFARDAFGFCDDSISHPHCQIVDPGRAALGHLQPALRRDQHAWHATSTDAWYAALAIEWGCEWVTFDRDFARFPGLNCTILAAPNRLNDHRAAHLAARTARKTQSCGGVSSAEVAAAGGAGGCADRP